MASVSAGDVDVRDVNGGRADWRFDVAGILLGLGIGGFFDGIVFHQLLQWHHMLTSAGFPPDSIANLKVDTLADGLFHVLTLVLTVIGVVILVQARSATRERMLVLALGGLIFIGWGAFNLVEGVVDHYLLGIHHVRDDLPSLSERQLWDAAFLA